jgi:hypothetical protein
MAPRAIAPAIDMEGVTALAPLDLVLPTTASLAGGAAERAVASGAAKLAKLGRVRRVVVGTALLPDTKFGTPVVPLPGIPVVGGGTGPDTIE